MFFVHPQIKLNKENLRKIFFGFLNKPDLSSLEKELSFYFPGKKIVFTDMARSAFKIIIEKLNLQNSKIIVPAYICDIFYPIFRKYNIKPLFVDINLKTFSVNLNDVEQKISLGAKAILISHTYGLPAETERIKNIKNLAIIEDCAHSFGAKQRGDFVGNFGQAAFFSIYKQFPTFRGGFLVYPENWNIKLPETRFSFRDFISFLNSFCFFAFLFKTFGQSIAPKIVRKEKMPEPAALNSISLNFFSHFLEDFKKGLEKRIDLALFFQGELEKLGFEVQESKNNVFCYLSALVPKEIEGKRDKLVKDLMKEKVFLTRIWHTPIILNKEVQKEHNINFKEFPNTLEAAKRIINFPLQNHYNRNNIKVMINKIKRVLAQL